MKKPRGWYNKQRDQKKEGKLKEMIKFVNDKVLISDMENILN